MNELFPAVLARPKSRIFNVQSDLTTMFEGFKSRWITAAECKCLMPKEGMRVDFC